MFNVIGISAHFHDSACCLLQDGIPVAAAQEERFTRVKHDKSLPVHAFRWCLQHAELTIADVDCIAYYEDPRAKLERQLWQDWPAMSPARGLELWQGARAPLDAIREVLGYEGDLDVCMHHHSHAASAFLMSGADEAAILTVDGVGEWTTTGYGHGRRGEVDLFEEVHFPHSLGLLYSTLTDYLGFAVNDGEYKVMGLAPYGRPVYTEQIGDLVRNDVGGQFRLNTDYFDFTRRDCMYSPLLPEKLGIPPRQPDDPILPMHKDLARSLQAVLEELLLQKVRYLHDRVPVDCLCMAGGVALNCVANGRILREGPFRTLFVQPAAGDAGGALGAALIAHGRRRPGGAPKTLSHVYLGPAYESGGIADLLDTLGIAAVDCRDREPALIAATVDLLAAGKVIGWFQGRMEFGPRALGARSILGDARIPNLADRVNELVKQRERFRPFAPAVSAAAAADHFDLDHPSPFMLETCRVISPLALPSITHVDGSARVQTVDAATHPRFAALLDAFAARTGCPILLNTSFNLSDEPIVATPADALVSFARSELDALVLEDFIVHRSSLSATVIASCRERAGAKTRAIRDRTYTF